MDFIQRGQVIETFDDWMDLFFSGFLSIYMGRLGNEVELLDLRLKIEWMRVIGIDVLSVIFKYEWWRVVTIFAHWLQITDF